MPLNLLRNFNKDLYCDYSPEQINNGTKVHLATKILNLTSASTPEFMIVFDEFKSPHLWSNNDEENDWKLRHKVALKGIED